MVCCIESLILNVLAQVCLSQCLLIALYAWQKWRHKLVLATINMLFKFEGEIYLGLLAWSILPFRSHSTCRQCSLFLTKCKCISPFCVLLPLLVIVNDMHYIGRRSYATQKKLLSNFKEWPWPKEDRHLLVECGTDCSVNKGILMKLDKSCVRIQGGKAIGVKPQVIAELWEGKITSNSCCWN